jgi:GT2 family glycosyltransferase
VTAASIIIVSYRSRADIPRLLDCLARQSCTDFETILIDNASPDGLAPDEADQRRASIYVANEANVGFAQACNQGLALARGHWSIFLNPDAFPEADWLDQLLAAAARYPQVRAFGSLQLMDEAPGQLDGLGDCLSAIGIAWRGGHGQPVPPVIADAAVFSPCAAAAMWQTDWLRERLGGFEESFTSYYEDVDLGFRHRLLGGTVVQVARAVVRHRGSASSGRYSDYAVYHGNRNRLWCHVACMPGVLFWLLLPLHVAATLLLWAQAARRGAGKSYGRAVRDGLLGLPAAWQRRQALQAQRTVGTSDLARALSWSPLALALRRPVLMELPAAREQRDP